VRSIRGSLMGCDTRHLIDTLGGLVQRGIVWGTKRRAGYELRQGPHRFCFLFSIREDYVSCLTQTFSMWCGSCKIRIMLQDQWLLFCHKNWTATQLLSRLTAELQPFFKCQQTAILINITLQSKIRIMLQDQCLSFCHKNWTGTQLLSRLTAELQLLFKCQ
jgi:hypothetical protein